MGRRVTRLFGMLLICSFIVCLFKGLDINAAAKVKLNATKKTMYVGEKFQLELSGTKGKIKWTTSNKKKATVKNGLVTAVKNGSVTIKAKDASSGKTYKCKITVKKNAISNKKLSLKTGESFGLTLKGNVSAEWTSSDDSILYVNNGTVTGLKTGTATVTAKAGSNMYTCKVTVSEGSTDFSEPVELTLWCLQSNALDLNPSYAQAISDLKTAYPNVTVNYKVFEMQNYKMMIKAAIAANDLPDIFFTWSCAFLGDFVSNGVAYCLDDVMSKYIKSGDISKAMLGNTTYDGKCYGVPLTMNVVTLFANKELLAEVGYKEVPKTIEDLMQCCDKLLEKGIIPFGCSSEEWCISEYFESIVEKYIGADKLNDIFAGRASFNNEMIAESVDLFRNMISLGYFDINDMTSYNDEVINNFMNGKYAIYMNGSWNCGNLASDPEFSKKVIVGEFPVIDPSNAKIGQLIGGPSDTLAVSANSKNSEVAAEYAVALGKLICKYGYLEGDGLPAWKIGYDDSGVNSITKEVAKMCENAKGYVLFGDTAMSSDRAYIYLEYLSKLLSDDMDGQKFIKGLSKDID